MTCILHILNIAVENVFDHFFNKATAVNIVMNSTSNCYSY